jgi:hypothetical protein
MSSPPPLFFLSSCPFLLFDRAAGFLPPRPRIGAGRRAQMLSRLAALQRPHPAGASAFTASSNDGRLDRSGRLHSLFVIYVYLSWCQRALFRSRMLFSAGLATKSMARAMFASTYIRQLRSGLPRCCLHGRSRRRDGTHLWDGRSASADLRFGSTVTHPTRPTHPRLGCRNSAQCRRYRVRVAPCGTRPCSR